MKKYRVALLANLKVNAPKFEGMAEDQWDDLDSEKTINALMEAMRAGAVDFRTKPLDGAEIIHALRDALEPLPQETLEQVERDHILAVLNACGGNISEAARRLGLYRRTLQRKLQKLPQARG